MVAGGPLGWVIRWPQAMALLAAAEGPHGVAAERQEIFMSPGWAHVENAGVDS